jgi:hypothetical protein
MANLPVFSDIYDQAHNTYDEAHGAELQTKHLHATAYRKKRRFSDRFLMEWF